MSDFDATDCFNQVIKLYPDHKITFNSKPGEGEAFFTAEPINQKDNNRRVSMIRTPITLVEARRRLRMSQAGLAKALDMSIRQISKIETEAAPLQRQTELAVECLLRRENKW